MKQKFTFKLLLTVMLMAFCGSGAWAQDYSFANGLPSGWKADGYTKAENGGTKVGSSKAASLTSPTLNLSGDVQVLLNAEKYNNDKTKITVSLLGNNEAKVSPTALDLTKAGPYTITISNCSPSTQVKFSVDKSNRFYLYSVQVKSAAPTEVPAPTFSVDGTAIAGDSYEFVEGSTVNLTLTAPEGATSVMYKMDGAAEQTYSDPIQINKACSVEAWAINGALTPIHKTVNFTIKGKTQTLSFAQLTLNATDIQETVQSPELTGAMTTVTYTSGNKNVATIDDKGLVTINGVGQSVITATAAAEKGTDGINYSEGSASYTLTVTAAPRKEIFAESFATDQGDFTVENVPSTSTNVWVHDAYKGNPYMKAQVKGNIAESWLISPWIDLTNMKNCTLAFEQAANFFNGGKGRYIKVKSEESDWKDLTIDNDIAKDSWTFIPSSVNLKDYSNKKIQFAFVYKKDNTNDGAWEVNNVKVTGVYAPTKVSAPVFMVGATAIEGEFYEFENGTTVNLTINTPAEAAKVMYKIGNGNEQEYTAQLKITQECTVDAWGTNETLPSDHRTVQFVFKGLPQTLTFEAPKTEANVNEVFNIPTLNGAKTNVTYESSNTEVATIENGQIKAVSEGTTTITATAEPGTGSDGKKYSGATATFDLKVVKNKQTLSFAKPSYTILNTETFDAPKVEGAQTEVTYSSSDIKVATVNASGEVTILKSGKTTIKAVATATDVYESAEASYELTVECAGAVLPFEFNGKTGDLDESFTNEGVTDNKKAPYLKFGEAGNQLTLKLAETPETLSFDLQANTGHAGAWAGEFVVETSEDGNVYSIIKSIAADLTVQTLTNVELQLNQNIKYIRWRSVTKDGNTLVGNIKVSAAPYSLTVGKTGYATFAAKKAYTMPAGLQGGIVTVNGDLATVDYVYGENAVVPAEEALVIKGAAYQYTLPVTTTAVSKKANNKLKGAFTNETINAVGNQTFYVFSNNSGVLGFRFQKGTNGASVQNIANKAYLVVEGSTPTNGFRLVENDVTGVENVEMAETEQAVIYTLAGVRVNADKNNLPKGLYIINGKKVLVK